jgi:hypothetical protein
LPRLAELDRQDLGRIYALLFDNGEFKVGQTLNIRSRVNTIAGDLRRRRFGGDEIIDGWYSQEHEGYRQNEVRLLAFCVERCGPPTFGLEIFSGDFEPVVRFAEEITAAALVGGAA